MMIGFVSVKDGAVGTRRDSFILSTVSVVSVRRPYLAGSILLCGAALGFGVAFIDLLYIGELAVLVMLAIGLLLLGSQIAQLMLLSRDLKGTELSSAIWGSPDTLQKIRAQIVRERQRVLNGETDDA